MLGISTSVFNEAGSLAKDWLKNPLNASFLYWYFLPAAGLILLQLMIVGPALGHPRPEIFNIEARSTNSTLATFVNVASISARLSSLKGLVKRVSASPSPDSARTIFILSSFLNSYFEIQVVDFVAHGWALRGFKGDKSAEIVRVKQSKSNGSMKRCPDFAFSVSSVPPW